MTLRIGCASIGAEEVFRLRYRIAFLAIGVVALAIVAGLACSRCCGERPGRS